MFAIDPTRLDLAREFKRSPFGPHSPELQAVLNALLLEAAGIAEVPKGLRDID